MISNRGLEIIRNLRLGISNLMPYALCARHYLYFRILGMKGTVPV